MEIQLKLIDETEFDTFKKDVKEIFSIAVLEEFKGKQENEVIPDNDIEESLYAPNAVVYAIYSDNRKIGGMVLNINHKTKHNSLDLFYIYPQYHNRGVGTVVWKTVEETFSETKVWELVTPYFEKRNIHFYVNKCGFHVVEFFCEFHIDPRAEEDEEAWKEEYFRFEKTMKV